MSHLTTLKPTNPKSRRCRIGIHNDVYLIHTAVGEHGLDASNTFVIKYCLRCGRLSRHMKNDVMLLDQRQISDEYWERLKALTEDD